MHPAISVIRGLAGLCAQPQAGPTCTDPTPLTPCCLRGSQMQPAVAGCWACLAWPSGFTWELWLC